MREHRVLYVFTRRTVKLLNRMIATNNGLFCIENGKKVVRTFEQEKENQRMKKKYKKKPTK